MTSIPSKVPSIRIQIANDSAVNSDGDFVLYWMIANRRSTWNFSLQRAVDWSVELGKPLLVFEALRCGYKWANDRIHAFVIQGMADNQKAFEKLPATYYPFLETKHGQGRGLLKELASKSCVVVSDDFPCFFLSRMIESANRQINTRFELIDSNGLYPMRDTDRVFSRAYDFRRYLQKNLLPHLSETPVANPFARKKLPELPVPPAILKQWPAAKPQENANDLTRLKAFDIDHDVKPGLAVGGSVEAKRMQNLFLQSRLPIYGEQRNQPEIEAASGFSPYLHFGHLSVHQVFDAVAKQADWNPGMIAEKANGSSSGWWGTSETIESFLDELITWREIGYNMCALREDYDQFSSLPDWARKTIREHAADEREFIYSDEQFEFGQTHDPLWNAAQWQLVTEGRIHNYLRMLWGKKIYQWSATAEHALETMIHLNNKYALDGRNPNSYSGIFWVLGRYDRAWGPERHVFGKLRYMTSENTARKVKVKNYVQKYAPPKPGDQKVLF